MTTPTPETPAGPVEAPKPTSPPAPPTPTPTPQPAVADLPSPAEAAGLTTEHDDPPSQRVQETVNVETEQGFAGVKVDPTPNEHYTVPGVIAGKPTPETDRDQAAEVAQVTGGRTRFTEEVR